MTRPRIALLLCVSLTAGLALLLVTHRAPAPRAPTFAEESAALWLEVARVRAAPAPAGGGGGAESATIAGASPCATPTGAPDPAHSIAPRAGAGPLAARADTRG